MNANSATAGIDMVSLDAAQGIVANAITALGAERVPLSDALGRVAAEDVAAEEDLVPYRRSAMDGYALRRAIQFRLLFSLRSGFQLWTKDRGSDLHNAAAGPCGVPLCAGERA